MEGTDMSQESGTVVVVGSLNADLVVQVERMPAPGETVRGSELVVLPGGKGANQAAAAALLGGHVSMLGAVGDDANGTLLLDAAARAGVDTTSVVRLDGVATGTAVISVDARGENSIIISPGANGHLTPEYLGEDFFAGAAVLCLCLEVSLETVTAAARHARDAGAQVLLNLSPYQPVGAELLELVDVLLVNDHEAADLLGRDVVDAGWDAVLAALAGVGVRRAVVTLGSRGSVVLDATAPAADQVVEVGAVTVEAVDTTGCGDAFTGALAQQIAAGATLVEAAQVAARVAAFAATRPGAQSSYPTLAQLAGVGQPV
ncbi:ribokinase [Sanguibacter suarezii]|uniref:ribokinase n=1 Tax=Sanguibacter suarezii TaxID=60921 RepID=UPI000AAD28C3|nr:ribokinase [Sanguibacter suarezii]